MEVIDKDVLHLEEFFREFLCKRITTKNDFNRFAGRLHFHRQFLQTHTIPFNLVLSVMERHQLICDDNRTIKSASVISLLHDIFYAADKLSLISKPLHWQEGHVASTFDADRKASLLSSFLATVFDPSYSRSITLLELKVALLLLCATNSVEELVQHHLNLLMDHNRCIHHSRFKLAAGAILKLLSRLDERVESDADALSILMGNAFSKVTGLAGLSDAQFYQFWNTENKKNATEISYFFSLLLFSRSLDTPVVHEGVTCQGCNDQQAEGANSIKGVRFKCTRCSSINLCTLCYLGDYQAGRHNPETHKCLMIEEASTAEENVRGKRGNLMSKLLKVFYFARNKRRNNLPREEDQSSVDGDGVKTIRFLDETPKNVTEEKGGKDKLRTVIEMLSMENRLFQENLAEIQQTCSPDSAFHKYLEQHKNILTAQIAHLQEIYKSSGDSATITSASPPAQHQQKFHSTPFRRDHLKSINWDLTASLDASTLTVANEAGSVAEVSKQIRGEDIEKTYYEANRSDRSLQEISTWLHLRESFCRELVSGGDKSLSLLDGSGMQSFRELLHKVRDILEDTYSDNAQLSTVTRQLEDALDDIIGKEEQRLQQKTTTGKKQGAITRT